MDVKRWVDRASVGAKFAFLLTAAVGVSVVSGSGVSAYALTSPPPTLPDKPMIANDSENSAVTFDVGEGGATPSELETLIRDNGLRLVETQSLYSAAGQTLTIGLPSVNGGIPVDAAAEIATTLQDLEDAATLSPAASKAIPTVTDPMPELIAVAKSELATRGVVFDKVVLSGVTTDFTAPGLTAEPGDPRAKSGDMSFAAAGCGRWYPFYSNSTSSSSSSGGRYNSLNFVWASSNLSALRCTGSSTFEPDFVTNNYDGHYYFAQSMKAWSTTMPNGYWDTNAFDAPEERVYTVGSSNTATVAANTNYNVYFRMSNGNYSSDTAKIVWQRGHYTWGCPSGPAWCIFSDESKIQYAWTITLPGYWTP